MLYKITLDCIAHFLCIKSAGITCKNIFWVFLSQFKYLYDCNEQWLTGSKQSSAYRGTEYPGLLGDVGFLCHLLLSRRNRELFCQREFLPKGWYLAFTIPVMMLNRAVGSALSTRVSFSTAYIFFWPFTSSHADSPTVSLWRIFLPNMRWAYMEKSYNLQNLRLRLSVKQANSVAR